MAAETPQPAQAGPLEPPSQSPAPAPAAGAPAPPPETAEAKAQPDRGMALYLLGIAPALAMLRQVVRAAPAPESKKAAILARIAGFWADADEAEVRLDFVDRTTRQPATAFLAMRECKHPHDTGAELDKLRPRVPEERWPAVLDQTSVLLFAVRKAFELVAAQTREALRELYAREGSGPPCQLGVDLASSTLFVEEEWPLRVGLRVRLAGERSPA